MKGAHGLQVADDLILKTKLTYALVVWWRKIKEKMPEVALEQLRVLVLREATRVPGSTPTVGLGSLLGIGSFSNSNSM